MVLVHLLEWSVAGPSCMGKDKGTGHAVVTVHGCRRASLELDLLTKCHHPVVLWENLLHLLLQHPGRNHLNMV